MGDRIFLHDHHTLGVFERLPPDVLGRMRQLPYIVCVDGSTAHMIALLLDADDPLVLSLADEVAVLLQGVDFFELIRKLRVRIDSDRCTVKRLFRNPGVGRGLAINLIRVPGPEALTVCFCVFVDGF